MSNSIYETIAKNICENTKYIDDIIQNDLEKNIKTELEKELKTKVNFDTLKIKLKTLVESAKKIKNYEQITDNYQDVVNTIYLKLVELTYDNDHKAPLVNGTEFLETLKELGYLTITEEKLLETKKLNLKDCKGRFKNFKEWKQNFIFNEAYKIVIGDVEDEEKLKTLEDNGLLAKLILSEEELSKEEKSKNPKVNFYFSLFKAVSGQNECRGKLIEKIRQDNEKFVKSVNTKIEEYIQNEKNLQELNDSLKGQHDDLTSQFEKIKTRFEEMETSNSEYENSIKNLEEDNKRIDEEHQSELDKIKTKVEQLKSKEKQQSEELQEKEKQQTKDNQVIDKLKSKNIDDLIPDETFVNPFEELMQDLGIKYT